MLRQARPFSLNGFGQGIHPFLGGQFQEFRSNQFIGDLIVGHSYESANTPNTNLVAQFANGWHDDGSSQAIADCYLRVGGLEVLGQPFDDRGNGLYVHEWTGLTDPRYSGKVLVQNFKKPNGEAGVIIAYPHNGEWIAHAVRGACWAVWGGSGGPMMNWSNLRVGLPASDETYYVEGGMTYTRQDFEEVTFLYNPTTGLTDLRSRFLMQIIDRTHDILNAPGGVGGRRRSAVWGQ